MQCPHCLADIPDGAKFCQFCRKRQPLTEQERALRRHNARVFGFVGAFVLLALFVIAAGVSYNDRQARLERAAECNGSLCRESDSRGGRSSGCEVRRKHFGVGGRSDSLRLPQHGQIGILPRGGVQAWCRAVGRLIFGRMTNQRIIRQHVTHKRQKQDEFLAKTAERDAEQRRVRKHPEEDAPKLSENGASREGD